MRIEIMTIKSRRLASLPLDALESELYRTRSPTCKTVIRIRKGSSNGAVASTATDEEKKTSDENYAEGVEDDSWLH
ncbi:DinI family protein [Salmonella enterica subsp. enterica]|nr:DinI family protein [Salmonella enterica subsp. enterica]